MTGAASRKQLFLDMIEDARKLSLAPNTYFTDQLNNTDSIAGYASLGEEIWQQMDGKVDAFVHSIGTGASLRGVASVLRRHNPKIRIVAVEPGESPVLSGGKSGAHDIEGIGIGLPPPLWDPKLADQVLAVTTADAKDMARRLARQEGIFAGTSSGGNVQAAIRVARELGPSAKVVDADGGFRLEVCEYGFVPQRVGEGCDGQRRFLPVDLRDTRLHDSFDQSDGDRLVEREVDGAFRCRVVLQLSLEFCDHRRRGEQAAVVCEGREPHQDHFMLECRNPITDGFHGVARHGGSNRGAQLVERGATGFRDLRQVVPRRSPERLCSRGAGLRRVDFTFRMMDWECQRETKCPSANRLPD